MVKKFTANCDFSGGKKHPVTLYIGNPSPGVHPLQFQGRWLGDTKGGTIPLDIMNSFSKLAAISEKNRVSFEELCSYVIDELKQSNSIVEDAKQATALSENNKKAEPISAKAAPKKAAAVPPAAKKTAANSAAEDSDKKEEDSNEE